MAVRSDFNGYKITTDDYTKCLLGFDSICGDIPQDYINSDLVWKFNKINETTSATQNFFNMHVSSPVKIGDRSFQFTGDSCLKTAGTGKISLEAPFCIEMWFQPTTVHTQICRFNIHNSASSYPVTMYNTWYNNKTSYLSFHDIGNTDSSGRFVFLTNTNYINYWNHWALVYGNDGYWRQWHNGRAAGVTQSKIDCREGAVSNIILGATTGINGNTSDSDVKPFIGYIGAFRISSGTARYTATFTPSTDRWYTYDTAATLNAKLAYIVGGTTKYITLYDTKSTSPSLAVKTPEGVGYAGLVSETASNKSSLRVRYNNTTYAVAVS